MLSELLAAIASSSREMYQGVKMLSKTLAAVLLVASMSASAAELHGNPAGRHMPAAPDVAKLYDRYLANDLSPDERYYLAVQIYHCAAWRGAELSPGSKDWPQRFAPARMPAGAQRVAAETGIRRCATLRPGPEELLEESRRLKDDAVRNGSKVAIADALSRTVKLDVNKAGERAIAILESGDADAILEVIRYIQFDEAFARMKDDQYTNIRIYRVAWRIYFCGKGADCDREKAVWCPAVRGAWLRRFGGIGRERMSRPIHNPRGGRYM